MKFEEAQQNMNFSYFGGGTGVLVSGLVWCIAGVVALLYSNQTSMLTLFIAGIAEVIFLLVIFNQSKGLILKNSERERLPV